MEGFFSEKGEEQIVKTKVRNGQIEIECICGLSIIERLLGKLIAN